MSESERKAIIHMLETIMTLCVDLKRTMMVDEPKSEEAICDRVRSICDLVTATEQLFAMYTVTPMEKEDRSNG